MYSPIFCEGVDPQQVGLHAGGCCRVWGTQVARVWVGAWLGVCKTRGSCRYSQVLTCYCGTEQPQVHGVGSVDARCWRVVGVLSAAACCSGERLGIALNGRQGSEDALPQCLPPSPAGS